MGSVAYFDKHGVRIKVCKIAYMFNHAPLYLYSGELLCCTALDQLQIKLGVILTGNVMYRFELGQKVMDMSAVKLTAIVELWTDL